MRRSPVVPPSPRYRRHPGPRAGLLLLAFLLPALAGAAVPPVLLSPGEADRTAEVMTACPTFSWVAAEGAAAHELAIFDLTVPERPELLLHRNLPGAAAAWTPARADSLPAERTLAWTVRGLDAAGTPLGAEEGWATPHRFRVPGAPGPEEIAAALEILRRWQAGEGHRGTDRPAGSGPHEPAATGKAVEASGAAAIRGENPATSGTNHGVWAQTSSPEGAGIVAVNLDGGPDILLDGTSAGVADTVLTERTLDRPAATAQSFGIENSLGGGMTLTVGGIAVSLEGHPHSGAAITSGTVADVRIASTIARDSEVMPIVLANDGPGSTLDADTLDKAHRDYFQARVSGTCPAGSAIQAVNADGSVACGTGGSRPPTVSVVDATAGVGEGSSIAIGLDGFPVISYVNDTAGTLKIAKCNDAACAGGDETINTIDPSGNVSSWFTSIAVPADGLPVVCYSDSAADSLRVAKCTDAACAGHDETLSTVDDAVSVFECDLAIGSDGLPVISYYDVTNSALRVAKCNDPACAPPGETKTTVDNTGSVGRYNSIAIGSDGFPVISYDGGGVLKTVKCNDLACSGTGETIATVDDPPTSAVGRYTSIAVPADGLPVISYQDVTYGDLKIAKCNVPACNSAGTRITTVHEAGDVGYYTSIAISADGLPLVVYQDSTADSLTAVKCNDTACAGLNETFTTLDDQPSDWVGLYASVTIGADGFPVASYHTQGVESVLKVVKCQTRSCFVP